MSSERPISDEHLNAFIDDQLDADEKSRILGAIKSDEELGRRACEFKRLQELVQHAYTMPPKASERQPRMRRGGTGWMRAVAASALLLIGGVIGWIGHAQQHPEPLEYNVEAMYLDDEKAFQTASIAEAPVVQGARKILLHISSDDPQKLEQALNTAENLLSAYKARQMPVELELVANAGGLNLLRADVSPFADRVEKLQTRFEELTFFACQTALNRWLEEHHNQEMPPLLPQALVTPNALDQILTRLQQGWVYISV